MPLKSIKQPIWYSKENRPNIIYRYSNYWTEFYEL